MRFKYETTVYNSIEAVWELITDVNRRSEWIHFIDECHYTHKKDSFVGSKFSEKMVFLRIPLTLEQTISDYKEHSVFNYGCKIPPFYPKVFVTAKDNKDGSVYVSLEFDIKMGAFILVPKKIINKQVDHIMLPLVNEFKNLIDLPRS